MQKIQFSRERDFSAVFSDTFLFLKQNFKSFAGAVLLIAGPFILISGVAMGYMQTSFTGFTRLIATGGYNYSSLFTSLAVSLFFGFIGQAVLSSVVYNYMLLYNSKPQGEAITVSEVGKNVLSNTMRLLGAMLLITILMIIIAVFAVFVFIGIASALGSVGGIIVGLLMFLAFFAYLPVLAYQVPASMFVVVRDGGSGVEGWSKVMKYLRGNFWWTWLIMTVAVISLYIVNILFTLPATIVALMGSLTRARYSDGAVASDHSLLLVALYTFAIFMSYFTSTIYLVLTTFNFLGHEEKSEGTGLFSKIDEIQ